MFIVIEGTDGTGKTTQAMRVVDYYRTHRYIDSHYLKFPNYESYTGRLIRKMLGGKFASDANDMNPHAASMMYALDRWTAINDKNTKYYDLFTNHPNDIIISDRYVGSNMIHQACKIKDKIGRIEMFKWIYEIEYEYLKLPQPDTVVYLHLDPALSEDLLKQRKNDYTVDIHETYDFLRQSAETGLECADFYNWKIVDCSNRDIDMLDTVENITAKILEAINQ